MSNLKIVPFLAYRDIIRDKKIVLLVVFLLAFSYINLTFFPAFLNGLSNTFQNEVVDTATSHIIIQPRTESSFFYLNFESSIRNKINLIPGVVGSSSHLSLSGTVFYKDKQQGISITALTPSTDKRVTAIHTKLLKGDYLNDNDVGQIILGRSIAGEKLEDKIGSGSFGAAIEGLGSVDVGDKVMIRFSNGVEKEYRVKGIVGSDGFSFVSQSVYITTKDAESVLGFSDKASAILVRLNDKDSASEYKKTLLNLGIKNADIQTWSEASQFAEGINQTFGIVTLVTTFVGVIIVISTIGIVIFINTARKKRIIGVLKAVGMQNNTILYIFLFESLLFVCAGVLIGVAILYASLWAFAVNPIQLPIGQLVPTISTDTALNSVLILIISAVVAGYTPSRSASRQEILDTIKTVE